MATEEINWNNAQQFDILRESCVKYGIKLINGTLRTKGPYIYV